MTNTELQIMESAPLRYVLSVPRGETTGLRPVLVFLHGYNEGAPTDLRSALTLHGPLRPGNPPAAVEEFIVVAPQLPERGDLWRSSDDEVCEVVQRVQAQHGGDPRRTYLTGFSYGGNGAFDIAILQPGYWAALWAVEPTRAPERDPGLPVWLSAGELTRRRQSGFTNTLRLEPPGTGPLGDRICTDEGLDHVGTATHAYQDERIYRWLLARERPLP